MGCDSIQPLELRVAFHLGHRFFHLIQNFAKRIPVLRWKPVGSDHPDQDFKRRFRMLPRLSTTLEAK